MNDPQARPMQCPVCDSAMNGKILVCMACWSLVPIYDQIGFRRQFDPRPQFAPRRKFKAEKIIRELREKNGTHNVT